MMRQVFFLAAVTALSTVSAAHAQITPQKSGTLEVKLRVDSSCEWSPGTGGENSNLLLDFGSTTLLTTDVDGQTAAAGNDALTITCSPGADYALAFDAGENGGGEISQRAMSGPAGETIAYQLYSNASRTDVLSTISGEGTGSAVPIPIYGRVPGRPNGTAPTPGNYTDMVTITLSF